MHYLRARLSCSRRNVDNGLLNPLDCLLDSASSGVEYIMCHASYYKQSPMIQHPKHLACHKESVGYPIKDSVRESVGSPSRFHS